MRITSKYLMIVWLSATLLACSESNFSGSGGRVGAGEGNATGGNGGDDPFLNNGGIDGDFGGGGNASGGDFNEPGSGILKDGWASPQELIGKLTNKSDVKTICEHFDKKTHNEHIVFPPVKAACNWSNNGNLSPANGFHMARREQASKLALPENAVVCSMNLKFPTQNMRYDDGLFFLFGGFMVMGIDVKVNWEKKGDLIVWDWIKHRGYNGLSPDPTYCIGGPGTCRIPVSESLGALSVDISEDKMHELTAELAKSGNYEFRLVITGDDDPSDCQHSGVSFSTDITYVVPD